MAGGSCLRINTHILWAALPRFPGCCSGSDFVVILPEVSLEGVVLGDAPGIMVHALDCLGGLEYGDTVVVVQGAGPVGMMGMILAKDAGAGKGHSDRRTGRSPELAREFGAYATLDIAEMTAAERIAAVMDMTDGRGADVVFECRRAGGCARRVEMARINGSYLIAGHYGDAGTVPINPHVINKKQISIKGVWSASNKHFLRGLTLLGRIPVEKLVTHRFTLDQINDALIAAERQEVLKAVIVP